MKKITPYILGTALLTFPIFNQSNAQEQTLSPTPYDCQVPLKENSFPSFLEDLLEKTRNCNLPTSFTNRNIQYNLTINSFGATLYFNEINRDLPDRQINGPGIIFTDERGNCTQVLLREGNGIISGDFNNSSENPRLIFGYDSNLSNSSSNEAIKAQSYCTQVFDRIRDFYNSKK